MKLTFPGHAKTDRTVDFEGDDYLKVHEVMLAFFLQRMQYVSLENAYSDKFCSGQVQPMSTEKVEFTIPAVDDLCDNGFNPWSDKCTFDFVADTTPTK